MLDYVLSSIDRNSLERKLTDKINNLQSFILEIDNKLCTAHNKQEEFIRDLEERIKKLEEKLK